LHINRNTINLYNLFFTMLLELLIQKNFIKPCVAFVSLSWICTFRFYIISCLFHIRHQNTFVYRVLFLFVNFLLYDGYISNHLFQLTNKKKKDKNNAITVLLIDIVPFYLFYCLKLDGLDYPTRPFMFCFFVLVFFICFGFLLAIIYIFFYSCTCACM